MSYRNKTYVVFDGDNDIYAYRFMKGWKALPNVGFNFHDAHDLGSELTDRPLELTIKRRLRERFSSAKQVIVLIGQHTRYLYRFVRWELEVALDLSLPIIAVNLNGKRLMDPERCPPIIKDEYVVHIPFKLAILRHALDQFPSQHLARDRQDRGPLYYPDAVYRSLGLPPAVTPAPITVRPPIVAAQTPRSSAGSILAGLLSPVNPVATPFESLVRGLPRVQSPTISSQTLFPLPPFPWFKNRG
ncbi:MAG TPA: TIR domain-containing protein [Terriglobia bacterium]|nr:TIR domain-containing protein [Terriglobia bacterium]